MTSSFVFLSCVVYVYISVLALYNIFALSFNYHIPFFFSLSAHVSSHSFLSISLFLSFLLFLLAAVSSSTHQGSLLYNYIQRDGEMYSNIILSLLVGRRRRKGGTASREYITDQSRIKIAEDNTEGRTYHSIFLQPRGLWFTFEPYVASGRRGGWWFFLWKTSL